MYDGIGVGHFFFFTRVFISSLDTTVFIIAHPKDMTKRKSPSHSKQEEEENVQRVYESPPSTSSTNVPPPTTGKKRKKESIDIDPKNVDDIVSPVLKKIKKSTARTTTRAIRTTLPSSSSLLLNHDPTSSVQQLKHPPSPKLPPSQQQQQQQQQPLVRPVQVPPDEVATATTTTTTTTTTTATASSSILQDISNASTPIEQAFRNMTPSPVTFTKNIVKDSNIVHHPSVIHPTKEQNGNNNNNNTKKKDSKLFFVYSFVWLVLHVMIAIGSDGVLCTPFWMDYQIDSPLRDLPTLFLKKQPQQPKKQSPPQKKQSPRVEVQVVEEIEYVEEIVEEIVDVVLPNPKLKSEYFQKYWKEMEAEKQSKDLQLAKTVLSSSSSTSSSLVEKSNDVQLQFEVEKERLQVWDNQLSQSEDLFQKQDFTLDEDVLVLDPNFLHQQQYHPPPPKSTTNKTINTNVMRKDVELIQNRLKNLATSTEIKVIQNKTNIQSYIKKTLQTALLSHPPIPYQEEIEEEDVDLIEMKVNINDLKEQMKIIKQEIYDHQINQKEIITNEDEEKEEKEDDDKEKGWNEKQVKDHVQTILERHDVTGVKDYASLRFGASIITEGSTFATSMSLVDQLPALNRLMAKANLRFYGHGPYAALNPTYPIDSLGQCWSIVPEEKHTKNYYKYNRKRGKYATLAITLSNPLSSISSVIVEHPIFASETSHLTAIQSFRVLAFETDDASSTPYQIGTFQYNIGTSPPPQKNVFACMFMIFVIHFLLLVCYCVIL